MAFSARGSIHANDSFMIAQSNWVIAHCPASGSPATGPAGPAALPAGDSSARWRPGGVVPSRRRAQFPGGPSGNPPADAIATTLVWHQRPKPTSDSGQDWIKATGYEEIMIEQLL